MDKMEKESTEALDAMNEEVANEMLKKVEELQTLHFENGLFVYMELLDKLKYPLIRRQTSIKIIAVCQRVNE